MELNIFKQYKIDNSTELIRAMELKEAARLIRIHYKTLFAAEPNTPIILEILESCAQILEQIDEKKIRYERYGEWITSQLAKPTKEWKCTACQGLIMLPVFTNDCYYDYCPNCGAKMREGINEI